MSRSRGESSDSRPAGVPAEVWNQVYDELRALAARALARERPDHSLDPTALVHEAWLRLEEQDLDRLDDRARFCGAAALMMRRILVNHAQARRAQKRGGGGRPLRIDTSLPDVAGPRLDMLALDEALERLSALDPRQGRIVELRFFGGLSIEETAAVLEVSTRTVHRDWLLARAFIRGELTREPSP